MTLQVKAWTEDAAIYHPAFCFKDDIAGTTVQGHLFLYAAFRGLLHPCIWLYVEGSAFSVC